MIPPEEPPKWKGREGTTLVVKPDSMVNDWRRRFDGINELDWEEELPVLGQEMEKLEEQGEELVLTVIEPPTVDVPGVRNPNSHLGAVCD